MEKVNIQGMPCLAYHSETDALSHLKSLLTKGKRGGYAISVNAEKMNHCRTNPALAKAVNHATVQSVDGSAATLALKFKFGLSAPKINYPKVLLTAAHELGLRLLVYGATEENNKAAVEKIREGYRGIKEVKGVHGYVDSQTITEELKDFRPDVVLMGLGSPLQEQRALEFAALFPEVFMVCCGGGINVIAGKVEMCPKIISDNYLEWAFRLWRQPWRIKRQKVLPKVFCRILIEAATYRMGLTKEPTT